MQIAYPLGFILVYNFDIRVFWLKNFCNLFSEPSRTKDLQRLSPVFLKLCFPLETLLIIAAS